MNLLIFFAIPFATILLAIVFQKVLKCPILVSITFFAIYLIVAFSLAEADVIQNLANALVAVIVYSVIAFITAWLVNIINILKERFGSNREETSNRNRRRNSCEDANNDLLRISCRCNNGNSQELLTINSDCLGTSEQNENNSNCSCINNGVNENNRSCSYRKCNTKSI